MANAVIGWVKENPVAAGAVAVGFVVIVMMFSGGGSSEGDSGGTGSQGVAAYYGAVANQAAAGAAIQMEQIKANATTNQTLIAASYGLEKSKVETASTNYQAGLAADLGKFTVANQTLTANNLINLQNSALNSNEIVSQINANRDVQVAKANANAGKPSTGQDIAGVISSIGSAVGKFF